MGKFYTGKGDKGISYVGKRKIKKTNPFVEILGQFDELNSMIGVVKSMGVSASLKKSLHEVQEALFIIQASVAYKMLKEKRIPPVLSSQRVKEIEGIINNIEKKLNSADKFVISGTTHVSAWLDFLRAKSRNVERGLFKIKELQDLNSDTKAYLNRLSSLFFALARWEARKRKEFNPKYK